MDNFEAIKTKIYAMEKDIAIIANAQEMQAKTLDEISQVLTNLVELQTKTSVMEKELKDFKTAQEEKINNLEQSIIDLKGLLYKIIFILLGAVATLAFTFFTHELQKL